MLAYVLGVRVILESEYNAHEKAYGVVGSSLNGTAYMRKGGITGTPVPYDVASLSPTTELAGGMPSGHQA